MALPNINREAALRIALAARALPDVSVGDLVEVLHTRINGEISEKSLTTVSVTDLKLGFARSAEKNKADTPSLSLPEIKQAVRILWGETNIDSLPATVPLVDIPQRSVRVAIASNTGEQLDGHFGSCLRFLIYQIGKSFCQLIDIRSAIDADVAEDKNLYRAKLVNDCQVLYVVSIGGPAAAKVVRANVYPIKKPNGGEAKAILAELQGVMENSPPPWLAKYMGDSAEERVRFERDYDEEFAQ